MEPGVLKQVGDAVALLKGIEGGLYFLGTVIFLQLLLPWVLQVLKVTRGGNGQTRPISLADAACKAREHLAAYADEQGEVLSGLVEAQRQTATILERIQAGMDAGRERAREFEAEARRQWEAVQNRDAIAEKERALAIKALERLEVMQREAASHPPHRATR